MSRMPFPTAATDSAKMSRWSRMCPGGAMPCMVRSAGYAGVSSGLSERSGQAIEKVLLLALCVMERRQRVRIYPEPSCIFSQSIIECLERLPGRYRDGTVDVCDEEYLFGRYGIRRHERPVILLHAVQHGFLFGCFDAECLSGYRYVYHRHMFSIRYCRPRPRPRICPGRAFGVRCR